MSVPLAYVSENVVWPGGVHAFECNAPGSQVSDAVSSKQDTYRVRERMRQHTRFVSHGQLHHSGAGTARESIFVVTIVRCTQHIVR